ncbi:trichohyalin-like isoform X2 [Pomacea canaliculata]|uniref:trichohyalin-like isoform X2 n=1 Tax=Pomacea canaliculata TaxID=400727 RepID=UPI000D732297|nr:trichohyalin-like isoform X2 [Pomacea canaliculata]
MQLQQKQLTKLDSPRSPSLEGEKQLAVEATNRLVAENKELKDRVDELMVQIEEMQRQSLAASLRHGSSVSARRNSLASRIPVRTQTSSLSSEMDDDELLSSSEGFYFNRRSLLATPEESDSSPSLSSELKHLHRQRRGELRERERKEVEHAYRVEIADLEDKQREEKEQIIKAFEREKTRMTEDFQAVMNQRLAEQQKELQNIFALEKQDLLQQYESRKNYMELQHQQKIQQVLAGRAREEIQDKEKFPRNQMKEISDLHRHLSQNESIIQDLKKENAALIAKLLDVENKLSSCLNKELVWQKECQQKLQEQQSAFETKLQSELKRVFDQGESALEGKLKDDFYQLVQKRKDTLHEHQQPNTESGSASENSFDREALYSAFEQEKVTLESHYESKILNLEQELANLREASITEQNVTHSLQTWRQVTMMATSTEMTAGEKQRMQGAEEVKVQAAHLRELESFSGLQVSLVESQRHASSPQQALVEHMQLSDRIMAEAEKQRQGERTAWEEEKREMQLQLRSTQDLHRNLVLQHKQLCRSSTKLAEIAKDLYVRNVELTCELQQTERRLRTAQRQCRKLQETCQTWRNTVHRIVRPTGH